MSQEPPSRVRDWDQHHDHFEWFRDTFRTLYAFSGSVGLHRPPGCPFGFRLDQTTGLHLMLLMLEKPKYARRPALAWVKQTDTSAQSLPTRLKLWNTHRRFYAQRAGITPDNLRQLALFAAILDPAQPTLDLS